MRVGGLNMKKLSDERIKELIEIVKDHHIWDWAKECDETEIVISALQELLELRKNAPKFTIGQRVWVIFNDYVDGWSLGASYPESIQAIANGGVYVSGSTGVIFICNDRLFPTKSKAQTECDKRNGEKK